MGRALIAGVGIARIVAIGIALIADLSVIAALDIALIADLGAMGALGIALIADLCGGVLCNTMHKAAQCT